MTASALVLSGHGLRTLRPFGEGEEEEAQLSDFRDKTGMIVKEFLLPPDWVLFLYSYINLMCDLCQISWLFCPAKELEWGKRSPDDIFMKYL